MHGLLLVDKPEGITSNDLVGMIKRHVRPSKVGHSGTLDSAASGLMVVLIGAATRCLDFLEERRKRYSMTVRLGEETDSGDREGTVIRTGDPSTIELEAIQAALEKYKGVMDQIPPHYSAIKKNGVPLYRLARRGVFPELAPRRIEIFSLDLLKWDRPLLYLDLECSRGTYARAVARDLGDDLGVGGRLEALRRTSSGAYSVEGALTVDEIADRGIEIIEERLVGLADALAHIPELKLLAAETRRLMKGGQVSLPRNRAPRSDDAEGPTRLYRVVSGGGKLVILVKPSASERDVAIRPVKVFNTLELDAGAQSPELET